MAKIQFPKLIEQMIARKQYPDLKIKSMKDHASRKKLELQAALEEFKESKEIPDCYYDESTSDVVKRLLAEILDNERKYEGKTVRNFDGAGKL